MKKVIFIGAGSMAEALIQGWIKNNVVEPQQIYVSNRSNDERLTELQQNFGVEKLSSLEELKTADLVILAMKPKDAKTAMAQIAPYMTEHTAVLSVLAGIGIETVEEGLGIRPVARVMPNTSATIGMSASGIAFNQHVTDVTRAEFVHMLEAVGIVIEVEEDKLHAVTALSGSGPAYLYYLLEAFETVGAEFDLPKEVVRKLMVQTIAGSAEMLKTGKEEPAELRRKVTSPGGTTEAGIRALENMQFTDAIASCIRSAETRSRELAAGK